MEVSQGQVRFFDGMRVSREHLEHFQELSQRAAMLLRASLGTGAVCHGLRTTATGPGQVNVGPGLAIDGAGRALEISDPEVLDLPEGRVTLVLVHGLRSDTPFRGIPTLLHDQVRVEIRNSSPPYADGAVRFAEVEASQPLAKVRQSGQWYLPPLRHGHTGKFGLDEQLRWRFDGAPSPFPAPDFDSGPLRVEPGERKELIHGLGTSEVQVVVESVVDGTRSAQGFGRDFWYEVHSENAIRICCAPGAKALLLRARVWTCGSVPAGDVVDTRPPVSDAGDTQSVSGTAPFALDGGRSRAFGNHHLAKYIWTQLS